MILRWKIKSEGTSYESHTEGDILRVLKQESGYIFTFVYATAYYVRTQQATLEFGLAALRSG